MRTLVALVVVLVPRLAAAEAHKLTLDQVIDRALASPRADMNDGDREAAAARVDEADAARLPRIKATAFGTISPDIKCTDAMQLCLTTAPKNFALKFSGFFGGAQLDVTQPLFTFGKISHARSAARAGLDAQNALADEAAGDLASDAARAYWGLKLARELGNMLDDGIEEIAKAKTGFDDKPDTTIQDRQRVAVLLAEAKAQRAEAAQGEAQALAGLRAVTDLPDADIDDAELAALEHVVPDTTRAAAAADRRPQRLAASSGARAADELAALESAQYLPDIALVGSALIARAQGATDPPSVFAYDPYNRSGAGVVLGLSWTLEPWNVKARSDRAHAEAKKMHAQAELAALGARYDAETARSEAAAAHDKVAATVEGEKAARTWLAAVLQNEAIGTAEPKDLADAYIAWFQMRARWAMAVFQWNVAVVRLGRASGEFRAGAHRPR
jgi:outer membrane protein TolC